MAVRNTSIAAALACATLSFLAAGRALAVAEQDFDVNSTKDLVGLCSTQPTDPLYTAAVNFCEGFVVGAYQYYQVTAGAEGRAHLVCLPNPMPTRNESVHRFVQWASNHQKVLATQPVEGLFEFLSQTYPCHG